MSNNSCPNHYSVFTSKNTVTPQKKQCISYNGYITALEPNSGPEAGGNNVTIIGFNLSRVKSVCFNNISVTFQIINNTTIRIKALPRTGSNTVPVFVSFGNFTSNILNYTYTSATTITSINPSTGPSHGGNVITISGFGLTDIFFVNFGNVSTDNFEIINDSTINVVVPNLSNSTNVNVTVENSSGRSNSLIYTTILPPII